MFKVLWNHIKGVLRGKKRAGNVSFQAYIEMAKPDPNYKPQPQAPKPPKPVPVQPPLKCPHCEHVFDKVSGSRRNCPECKKEIIIRTENKVKLLFTPEAAERFDADRQRRYNRNNLLRYYVHQWPFENIGGEAFDDRKSTLEKDTNSSLTDEEFALYLLNERLDSQECQSDLFLKRNLYHTIARLQHHMGVDTYEAKAACFRCDLLHDAQQSGYASKVRVHTGCDCDKCKKVEGRIMSIQDALIKMPLPVRGCEMNTFARYSGYVEDIS